MISIIIPTYNRSEMLLENLQSLKLIWNEVEIVIVNDFSRDDTEERLKQFINENKNNINIKYIKNPRNLGAPASVNVGINNSSNNFVFLIADDTFILEPENTLKVLRKYENNKNFIIATQILMESQEKQYFNLFKDFFYRMFAEIFAGEIYNYNGDKKRVVKYCSGIFGFNKTIGILFDEKSYIKNFFRTESEFEKRAKNIGIKILYYPNIKILHKFAKYGGLRQKSKRDTLLYCIYNHITFLRIYFKISKYFKIPCYFILKIITHPNLIIDITKIFNDSFKRPIKNFK